MSWRFRISLRLGGGFGLLWDDSEDIGVPFVSGFLRGWGLFCRFHKHNKQREKCIIRRRTKNNRNVEIAKREKNYVTSF
jgi:hypothetical protein